MLFTTNTSVLGINYVISTNVSLKLVGFSTHKIKHSERTIWPIQPKKFYTNYSVRVIFKIENLPDTGSFTITSGTTNLNNVIKLFASGTFEKSYTNMVYVPDVYSYDLTQPTRLITMTYIESIYGYLHDKTNNAIFVHRTLYYVNDLPFEFRQWNDKTPVSMPPFMFWNLKVIKYLE